MDDLTMNKIRIFVVCLGCCGFSLLAKAQNTFNVPSVTTPTIQSAIALSASGDTILVAAGTYQENLIWPNHDIVILGAGIGQSIVDGGLVAPCVTYPGPCTNASILDGFTLKKGMGAPTNYGFTPVPAGGGLYLNSFAIPAPTVRNCEITQCVANQAAAMLLWRVGSAQFENLHIHGNTVSAMGLSAPNIIAIDVFAQIQPFPAVIPSFRNCVIEGHSYVPSPPSLLGRLIHVNNASIRLKGCEIKNNTVPGRIIELSQADQVIIAQSRFIGNTVGSPLLNGNANSLTLRDCLFSGNSGGIGGITIGQGTVLNCTFVGNQGLNVLFAPAPFVIAGNSNASVTNCLIWDNYDSNGAVLATPILGSSGTPAITNSNIQNMGGVGVGGIDADPLFVDPANSDYRLQPGSPSQNSGANSGNFVLSGTDVRGLPRLRQGVVDMGCYESQSMAHHPAAKGRIGELVGGPYDILAINGTAGGPLRKVVVPLGSSSTMSMLQPSNLPLPAKFVIFGFLGEANFDSVVSVPLGIGNMMFAPSPLVPPFFQSIFFIYTDNYNTASPQLVSSNPTPWTSGFGPTIPFPITLTFQGVIEELGTFRPTNAIIFEVK